MVRLENWSIVSVPLDPYKAPEICPPSLYGQVFDHPRFEDGKTIITSTIREVTEEGKVRTYSGSEYELGEIDKEYEKAFPNAKERLIHKPLKKLDS